jgi:hypothetical protein
MRLTKIYRSDTEAKRASSKKPLNGWYPARITEAGERPDKNGDDMIELLVSVRDAQGDERQLRDWLTGHDKGALKLRHCCEACGPDVIAKYEAGEELQPEDFVTGHDVMVKIEIEKRRGFPDQNRITDYRAVSSSSVVTLPRAVEGSGWPRG